MSESDYSQPNMDLYIVTSGFNYRKDCSYEIHAIYNNEDDARNYLISMMEEFDEYFIFNKEEIKDLYYPPNNTIGDLYSCSKDAYEDDVYCIVKREFCQESHEKVEIVHGRHPSDKDPEDIYFTLDEEEHCIKNEDSDYFEKLLRNRYDDLIQALNIVGNKIKSDNDSEYKMGQKALILIEAIKKLPKDYEYYRIGYDTFYNVKVGTQEWATNIIMNKVGQIYDTRIKTEDYSNNNYNRFLELGKE